jgi:hypothetical protein
MNNAYCVMMYVVLACWIALLSILAYKEISPPKLSLNGPLVCIDDSCFDNDADLLKKVKQILDVPINWGK